MVSGQTHHHLPTHLLTPAPASAHSHARSHNHSFILAFLHSLFAHSLNRTLMLNSRSPSLAFIIIIFFVLALHLHRLLLSSTLLFLSLPTHLPISILSSVHPTRSDHVIS